MSRMLLPALSIMLLAFVSAEHHVEWYRDFEPVPITDDISRNAQQVYRLPETVVPLEYDIHIDLYFSERTDRPFSYDGRETIIIQAIQANVTEIVLHANVDSINEVSVLTEAGTPFPINLRNPITLEPQYHFLRINLDAPLEVRSNYTLYIDYSSTMNEGPMKRGIWRGTYIDDDGKERFYATTHFQPYNARQAFPCWDEPLYKAVFTLHLSKPSNFRGSFSNTGQSFMRFAGENRIEDTFQPTPRMSSYLVTFLVSESFQVIAQDDSFSPPVRIIGRSNTVGLGDHALRLASRMTEYFDQYFGIPYSTLHPNLMNDHISSPDWASAGTENWGMVSYREMYMIIDSNETTMAVEHYAATLISHELAHKWFGNLVTCFWWSNTWINEGFASYFGYYPTAQMFPEYDHHEHFNNRYMTGSMSFDSGVSTVPMNHEVNTPAQVTGHFGTISYSKGAAFLRQTANIITDATFQKACRYFLLNNAFEPADQYDLYNAFEQAINEDNSLSQYSNFNFTDYYRIWVNDPGYPVLNVAVNHSTGEMTLVQERFFLSASARPTGHIYPIPITYSTRSNRIFQNVRPIHMMTGSRDTLWKDPREEWVIFNNMQHGHYRVNYDEKTWRLISDSLLNEPGTIHHLNRAQIVDDVFALMRSGRMTYELGFHIFRFLRNEVNFHVWDVAITGYTWLRNRLRHLPRNQAEFDSYIISYMENVINSVGYNSDPSESPTISMNRETVLHFACNLGHRRCIQESNAGWQRMKKGEWITPYIRRSVYLTGMREGDSSDFQFLLRRYRESNFANDKLEMLRGLGGTRDPQLLQQYLALTLTSEVRSHDKANSFNYALLGNQENAYTVLQFVKSNINAIRVAYVEDAPPTPVNTALSNLASYLDEPGLAEYEEWLRTTQSNSLQYNTVISAINSARNNMEWGTNMAETILAAARGSAAGVAVSAMLLAIMAIFAMVM
ncbi:hypothetical protein O3G_MSEX011122 [Manduca sexta]|uniref:Aminopeptidase n=2 Tax=Manduca sexta TaxID=7130 RepID=A0A922CUK9_MANSE|nr:hypothetical protein O3G_MSEX011122 [Manduca sexta]